MLVSFLLLPQTVAVLDTMEGVYVWRGPHADATQYALVVRACEAYCQDKELDFGRRVMAVQEGQEPLVFRARFQAWDDGGMGEEPAFQDVYEQRVKQLLVRATGFLSDRRRAITSDACTCAQYQRRRGLTAFSRMISDGVSKVIIVTPETSISLCW